MSEKRFLGLKWFLKQISTKLHLQFNHNTLLVTPFSFWSRPTSYQSSVSGFLNTILITISALGSIIQECHGLKKLQEYGKCSQICVNTYTNYTCSCTDGYKMINGSCRVAEADVIIYLSTENSIRSYNTRKNIYK